MAEAGGEQILSIDLGTSGPKVGLFSAQGEVIGYGFEPVPLILIPGGGAEQDPHVWWQAIIKAVRDLMARTGSTPESVGAVCCTSQWSGTVAVDREGRPLMNAIIWMDSRGAPYVRQITGGPVRIAGYGVDKLLTWLPPTGGIPGHAGKDPIAHILYIKAAHPEIYDQTYKFLEPKDYLNLRLTGKFTASFDSITLHWLTDIRDLDRVDYDPRLVELSTIDPDKLPELRPPNGILGELTAEAAAALGLTTRAQVMVGTPDLQSAALGSGAVDDYTAHLYIGTSAWIGCHVPFKKTDVLHNIASLPSAIPGRYLVSNEQQTAGACLTYLRDNLLFAPEELKSSEDRSKALEVFDTMAESAPPGSGGVIFTPWLYGERTPLGDRDVRSGFFYQSLDTTRAHLIRAVFEGVAFNARWLLGYVEKFVGRRLDPIHIVGGGGQADIWCQIHADILGRTVRQVKDPLQVNTRGAAYLAASILGSMPYSELSRRTEIAHTYTPDRKNQRLYNHMFKEFVRIYVRNRGFYRRMSRFLAQMQVEGVLSS